MKKLILLFIPLTLTFYCFEAVFDAQENMAAGLGNKVDLQTAEEEIIPLFIAAIDDCPYFLNAGTSPALNWMIMFSTTGSCYGGGDSCKEANWTSKGPVLNCKVAISHISSLCDRKRDVCRDPAASFCDDDELEAVHWGGYMVCAKALNSYMLAPSIFL